jgi:hypothetical protein
MIIFQHFTKACLIIFVLLFYQNIQSSENNYMLTTNTTLSNDTQPAYIHDNLYPMVFSGALLGGISGVFNLVMILNLDEHGIRPSPFVRFMLIGPTKNRFSTMFIRSMVLGAINGTAIVLLAILAMKYNSL